jgi:hypothetical protein
MRSSCLNPTATAADISGWFLTDDLRTPAKFRIPNGTSIPAGGYVVFDEGDFNATPGVPPSFSLDSTDDEVYLYSARADGTLTGYSQGFQFKAAANGVSFGRYTNSVGEVLYPAQRSLTLGAVNSGPAVGPVVINEIYYDPSVTGDEFVELKNITGSAVKLYDPAFPTNTWKLAARISHSRRTSRFQRTEWVVISGIEPAIFRQHANLPATIPVYGPYSGNLQDNGELLELLRPDGIDFETNGAVVTTIVPRGGCRRGALWKPNTVAHHRQWDRQFHRTDESESFRERSAELACQPRHHFARLEQRRQPPAGRQRRRGSPDRFSQFPGEHQHHCHRDG